MRSETTTTEASGLLATLESQRTHVLGILDGLPDEALRRPVLPSGWTCLGLVQHLALDVERFWFRAVIGGDPGALDDAPEDAWQVGPEVASESVLALYQREIALADAVILETPMDQPPAWWPDDLFGDFRLVDTREAMLHVIAETACHAGHLDVVRELIDGRRWQTLT
jgi:Protein of unknown function (DUF664)